MKRIISAIIVLLSILSVSSQVVKTPVKVIDLAGPFAKPQEVSLSRFVSGINYVTLETVPDALVAARAKIEVAEEFIIVRQFAGSATKSQILLFDRNTGKFIREIGKAGNGPGEYRIYSPLPFNHVKKEIYAISSSGDLLAYDISGKNVGRIKGAQSADPVLRDVPVALYNYIDSNIFAGYIPNISGTEKKKLFIQTREGILKIFPNYQTSAGNSFPPNGDFAKFYRSNNKLNFIETYCDTLYQVTKESLIPRYFFNWGKANASYSKQLDIKQKGNWGDYFFIMDIDESSKFIFLRLLFEEKTYTAFVDKKTGGVTFCKAGTSGISALRDDLTGLMDVVPKDITDQNEMIWIIQPSDLMKWLKENPEKASKAGSKLPWLKSTDDFSNPIIAIGKCKE